jgi:transglutaminase-like putative cysteine protease
LAQAGTNRQELVHALQQVPDSERDGIQFLVANMPVRDLQSLSAPFLLENVDLAYKAMDKAPWAMSISSEVFLNCVLPYANVTEARDNWRKRLYDFCQPLVRDCRTPGEAAQAINRQLFKIAKVKYSMKRRVADQGPFETMETGVATCTGLSILLVDACRSVGVPARVAGTPLWVNNTGNHTWVEIWDGGWHFAGAAEADPKGLDRGWFVANASQAIKNDRDHAIYAVSFKKTGLSFPLNWDPQADYVSAVNVTERYTTRQLPVDPLRMRLQVNVLDRPMGERIAAKVSITDSIDAGLHFEGVSRTDPADLNDHLAFLLPKERTYIITAELDGRKNRRFYSPGTNNEDLLVIHLSGVPVVMAPAPAVCALPVPQHSLTEKERSKLGTAVTEFFVADAKKQGVWKFPRALDALLARNESSVRQAVWEAYVAAPIHGELRRDFDESRVRFEEHVSPYTVKTVGVRPPNGWALFIAMHGGGGAPQELNDSQWMKMQRYYRDHPEAGGYRYLALRAPNNDWNGFYTSYVYPLMANLTRQFLLFGDVDPNKVFLMGYSHGGYGAFAIGPKMADRFAAIHSSAAALADGAKPQTLRNTPFTCMVGEKDTAYGRIHHAREFDQVIRELRGDRTDIYPVTVSIIADHPHSGLPDREKIAEMYPAVRNPVPRELTWPLTDRVNQDFFWLHVAEPDRGPELDATCRDNHITMQTTTNLTGSILLDGRLVDFRKPIWLEANGQTNRVSLKPELRILCETMQRRGDPDLAFTTQIFLPLKVTKPSNPK